MKKRGNTVLARVDDYIYKRLEEIVKNFSNLNLTKSECVYVILKAFFEVNRPPEDLERIREISIKMRKGLL